MADGRARNLSAAFQNMGVEGDRDVINAESEQARLRSEGGRGAAAWLRAIPPPSSYHTKVPNLHMRVMLQFWLGTIIPVLAVAPRECDCHWLRERGPDGGPGLADLRGRHDMVCEEEGHIGIAGKAVSSTTGGALSGNREAKG